MCFPNRAPDHSLYHAPDHSAKRRTFVIIHSVTPSFQEKPHRTLLALTVPVVISLIAEPLTGLIDTAFIARLGSVSMAALGVGTIALSSTFWIFNFLGIATQTDVARAIGAGDQKAAKEHAGLTIVLALVLGLITMVVLFLFVSEISGLLGANEAIQRDADLYIRIRLFGMPAVLVTVAGFGVLRGVHDMRSPLWIAIGLNVINLILDPLLIFGMAGFPALGIKGAAIASVIAQYSGAVATIWFILNRIGLVPGFDWPRARRLIRTGGDLFVRTGMLILFLVIATRQATRMGPDAGAVHQAIRQVWMFSLLFLDGFAVAGQSLIAYYLGSGDLQTARKVAATVCLWSLITGFALAFVMWAGTSFMTSLLIPASAIGLFHGPWIASIIIQPVSALTFATDGIHWGTGDFRYLRNAISVATVAGVGGLFLIDTAPEQGLLWIWILTGVWIIIRALFGLIRIWPGFGHAPLRVNP